MSMISYLQYMYNIHVNTKPCYLCMLLPFFFFNLKMHYYSKTEFDYGYVKAHHVVSKE